MTTPLDDPATLITRALPLQVAPPQPGLTHPVWHVPDEDPVRLQGVQALALAAQQRPQELRPHLEAYHRQYAHQYPQQPVQLTWGEGPADPAALALAELMLGTEPRR